MGAQGLYGAWTLFDRAGQVGYHRIFYTGFGEPVTYFVKIVGAFRPPHGKRYEVSRASSSRGPTNAYIGQARTRDGAFRMAAQNAKRMGFSARSPENPRLGKDPVPTGNYLMKLAGPPWSDISGLARTINEQYPGAFAEVHARQIWVNTADPQTLRNLKRQLRAESPHITSGRITRVVRRNPVMRRNSTSTEVRSPTRTSTRAHTAGNITVTGGAGAGATRVDIRRNPRQRRTVRVRRRNPMTYRKGGRADYHKLRQQDLFTGDVDRVQVRPSIGTAAWLSREPGWIRQDIEKFIGRLTDQQFLTLLARREGSRPPHDYQAGEVGKIGGRMKKNPELHFVDSLGPNQTIVSHGKVTAFISYKTPVACVSHSGEVFVANRTYSNTTTRHLNAWLRSRNIDPKRATRVPPEHIAMALRDGEMLSHNPALAIIGANPRGHDLGRCLEVRYRRERGAHKGLYRHPFKIACRLYAMPDGSLRIK